MNLSDLRRMDISARAQAGELVLSAPAGALTAEIRTRIAEAKQALLAELRGEHVNLVNFDSYIFTPVAHPISASPTFAAQPAKVGAGDTVTASRWWLIHYPDRDPLEVACCPEATHAEILERHPDAIAAEPCTPIDPEPWEERAAIAEFDGGLTREEAEQLAWQEDDRRRCDQCANLMGARCLAARRSEIVASRSYEPIRDLPRRCEGYAPGTGDADQRPGAERWPGLFQKGGE